MRFSRASGSANDTLGRRKLLGAEDTMQDDILLGKILKRDRVMAVVGLSDKP
jgi:hypothetical protein